MTTRYSDRIEPQKLSAEYAANFHRRKSDLVTTDDTRTTLEQTGAAYLGAEHEIPWPTSLPVDDIMIEMFIADETGSISPTGDDQATNDAWLPAVDVFAKQVLEAASALSVRLDGDVYVTASITPVGEVTTDPHFDDDLYSPDEGVGLVAIAGQIGGPRVACTPLHIGALRAPSQIPVTPDTANSFRDKSLGQQTAGPDRIVVFPQFAQLHAGPAITDAEGHLARHLLVLRAKTIPS